MNSLVSVNNGVELGEEAEEASIVHFFRYLCLIRISSLVGSLQGCVESGEGKSSLNLNSHHTFVTKFQKILTPPRAHIPCIHKKTAVQYCDVGTLLQSWASRH